MRMLSSSAEASEFRPFKKASLSEALESQDFWKFDEFLATPAGEWLHTHHVHFMESERKCPK
jgi:hypothetical protein